VHINTPLRSNQILVSKENIDSNLMHHWIAFSDVLKILSFIFLNSSVSLNLKREAWKCTIWFSSENIDSWSQFTVSFACNFRCDDSVIIIHIFSRKRRKRLRHKWKSCLIILGQCITGLSFQIRWNFISHTICMFLFQ